MHVGHVAIAKYFIDQEIFDEVWMVVSPQNPLKSPTELASFHHRLEMVKWAVDGLFKIKVSDVEESLPTPSYTSQTLRHLVEEYPQMNFSMIMGEDSLYQFFRWKDKEYILENFPFYVFPRNIPFENRAIIRVKYPDVNWVDAPLLKVSSTGVRKAIAANESLEGMLDKRVEDYIKAYQLYQ